MLHVGVLNLGDFVRYVGSSDEKEAVVKVIVISGTGDLVVEHPNGSLTVCKASELQIAVNDAASADGSLGETVIVNAE